MKAGRILLFACLFLWTGVSAWAIANPENRCSRVAAGAISNARYYDPELGRFIQPDTVIPDLSNPQSYNRYSYCVNDPLTLNDPNGKAPVDWANAMQPSIDIYYGGYIHNTSHTSTIGLFFAYMGQSVAGGYNDMLRLGTGAAQGGVQGWSQDLGRAGGIILTVAGPADAAATRLAPKEAPAPEAAPAPSSSDPVVARRPDGTPVRQSERPPRVSKPDPQAEGTPHTVLRWDTKGRLHGAKEYGNGGNEPTRDISFTQPTYPNGEPRPGHLPPPTQHARVPNPTGGTPARGPEEPLKKP